ALCPFHRRRALSSVYGLGYLAESGGFPGEATGKGGPFSEATGGVFHLGFPAQPPRHHGYGGGDRGQFPAIRRRRENDLYRRLYPGLFFVVCFLGRSRQDVEKNKTGNHPGEIDDKPPGSFRKKSARGCMFMGNKQIKEIRFGKLGGSQSLFLSSRGARPFF